MMPSGRDNLPTREERAGSVEQAREAVIQAAREHWQRVLRKATLRTTKAHVWCGCSVCEAVIELERLERLEEDRDG